MKNMKSKNNNISKEKLVISKELKNTLWGGYTTDVLERGLRGKITFSEYCNKMIKR